MPSPDKDIIKWNREIYNARRAVGQDDVVAQLKCKITERVAINKQLREEARRARASSPSCNTTRRGGNESVSLGGCGSTTDKNMTSDCSESDWSSDEEKSWSPIFKRARSTQNDISGGNHTSNSSTEISSLVPHVDGALGLLGHISGIPATVQTFLWENSKGVNEFVEALLKIKSHNEDEKRKKADEKRKKKWV